MSDVPSPDPADARISSYSKIWHLDHGQISDLFVTEVVIQEKLDGSQFSAGIINGQLCFRSRGAIVQAGSAPDLFRPAVEAFINLADQGKLTPGWVYRGEAICRPKHNTIKYDFSPPGGFALFDVETQPGAFLSPGMVRSLGAALGFYTTQTYYEGMSSLQHVMENVPKWLALGSVLGSGVEPEGVVVKNYKIFTPDKKVAMGKFVTAEFKEKHKVSWRMENPTRSDVILGLTTELRSEARWQKAVQHGEELGIIDPNNRQMKDLAYLAKEVPNDILTEEEGYIKQRLFDAFKGDILRGAVKGLPDWYRAKCPAPKLEAAPEAA